MRILGISAYYHDSAAALIEDGRIIAALQEERVTRKKHDPSFPANAVAYCLEQASGPIDAIAYYEKPLLKFERILKTFFAVAPFGFKAFTAAIPSWLQSKMWIPAHIEEALEKHGIDSDGKTFFATHHQSHAASAFFPSPFQSAAVLTLDGVGEWTTTAMGRGNGNELELLKEIRFPHSLGLLYSAFTYYCGFRVNSGEYKLMGLAPYGKPKYSQLILDKLIDLKPDGSFRLNLEYFGYLRGQKMTNRKFEQLFGRPARRPDTPVTEMDCDLARSIQEVTEIAVLRILETLCHETQEDNLCLAGGVALNCVANGRMVREGPFKNIWIQPASGDAGGALGAALALNHIHFNQSRSPSPTQDGMQGSYLGPHYNDAAIQDALLSRGFPATKLSYEELDAQIIEQLQAGCVIGYFQGRAEFGPRALGNRTILGDPRNPEMQKRMNLKIKFRESFRPFAPIVLEERAKDYFEMDCESPYMLLTAPVSKERRLVQTEDATSILSQLNQLRSEIPAVTHVDYSARVQTVSKDRHPKLHALLSAFEQHTGCPVLVNTSFNVRGEPPVCHPDEAIECFLDTEMDCLALGPFLLKKSDLEPHQLRETAQREFAPD